MFSKFILDLGQYTEVNLNKYFDDKKAQSIENSTLIMGSDL